MAEATMGNVTLDVVLRTRGEQPHEQVVGTITVPVRVGGTVAPEDIETALGVLARPEMRTRAGRRRQERAHR